MSEDMDLLAELALPPEFAKAPPWARALYNQQRADRHHFAADMTRLSGEVRELRSAQERVNEKLGEEPESDGSGGRGLVGDVRKMGRDLGSLMQLRAMGVGAVAAISVFGALILLGVVHWVQNIAASVRGGA